MIFNKSLLALALCASAAPAFGKKANLRKTLSVSESVKTDGELNDWDINSDFVGNMHNMMEEEDLAHAKAYAKWNCDTSTLCVLVLGEAPIDQGTDHEWIKDGLDLVDADAFSWVQADCGMPIGFEACFAYEEAGLHEQIEIQASYNNGNLTAIAASLDLSCAAGSSNGCGVDGVCASSAGESIATSRRKLKVDPCAKNPTVNEKTWKGWEGEKARKPDCKESEPKKFEVCACSKTYDELRAMDICRGKKIPICHRTGETICMPTNRWENKFCKDHPGAACGVCEGDDGTNARHGKYNKGKPQWKKGWWAKNKHRFQK